MNVYSIFLKDKFVKDIEAFSIDSVRAVIEQDFKDQTNVRIVLKKLDIDSMLPLMSRIRLMKDKEEELERNRKLCKRNLDVQDAVDVA
jgi:hypothetical protein